MSIHLHLQPAPLSMLACHMYVVIYPLFHNDTGGDMDVLCYVCRVLPTLHECRPCSPRQQCTLIQYWVARTRSPNGAPGRPKISPSSANMKAAAAPTMTSPTYGTMSATSTAGRPTIPAHGTRTALLVTGGWPWQRSIQAVMATVQCPLVLGVTCLHRHQTKL